MWPTCTLPAGLAPLSAGGSRETCIAAQALLTCEASSGDGAICLSDDPSQCPGTMTMDFTCHNECAADEYGVACGGVGPGNVPAPPAGCKRGIPDPAGIVFYCCPCEP